MDTSYASPLHVDSGLEIPSLEEAFAGKLPSVESLTRTLQKCRKMQNLPYVERMHVHMCHMGLEAHEELGNHLVPTFVDCGSMSYAQQMFKRLVYRNAYSWTSLIHGFNECGESEHALSLYEKMQEDCVCPSRYTYVALLKTCARLRCLEKARMFHGWIVKAGLESDSFIGNSLVDVYAKCGSMEESSKVFRALLVCDTVSWTALIAGYADHRSGEEVLKWLEYMQLEGLSPNVVTYVCTLKACSSLGAKDKGRELHIEICKKGFENDLFMGSSLVDMYAKCGSLAEARELFNKLSARSVISWNALIAGYAEQGLDEEALNCLEQMKLEGVFPDALTFSFSLKACGSAVAIDSGLKLHADIAKVGFESNAFLGNTLVDMYAKCGSYAEAWEVLDKLPVRDVVSWNALMVGYARKGDSELVLQLFDRLREEKIQPDEVTFLSVLIACSHVGSVDKGHKYFQAMIEDYGIAPTIKHYTCMMDLLCRAGHIDDVLLMVEKMAFQPDIAVWHTVLGACHKWGNVELGRQAFERAVRLDKEHGASFILMSNIYMDAHMWDDVENIEAMRRSLQAQNELGKSWVEIGGVMHMFVGMDALDLQNKDFYAKLGNVSPIKDKEESPGHTLDCILRDEMGMLVRPDTRAP